MRYEYLSWFHSWIHLARFTMPRPFTIDSICTTFQHFAKGHSNIVYSFLPQRQWYGVIYFNWSFILKQFVTKLYHNKHTFILSITVIFFYSFVNHCIDHSMIKKISHRNLTPQFTTMWWNDNGVQCLSGLDLHDQSPSHSRKLFINAIYICKLQVLNLPIYGLHTYACLIFE